MSDTIQHHEENLPLDTYEDILMEEQSREMPSYDHDNFETETHGHQLPEQNGNVEELNEHEGPSTGATSEGQAAAEPPLNQTEAAPTQPTAGNAAEYMDPAVREIFNQAVQHTQLKYIKELADKTGADIRINPQTNALYDNDDLTDPNHPSNVAVQEGHSNETNSNGQKTNALSALVGGTAGLIGATFKLPINLYKKRRRTQIGREMSVVQTRARMAMQDLRVACANADALVRSSRALESAVQNANDTVLATEEGQKFTQTLSDVVEARYGLVSADGQSAVLKDLHSASDTQVPQDISPLVEVYQSFMKRNGNDISEQLTNVESSERAYQSKHQEFIHTLNVLESKGIDIPGLGQLSKDLSPDLGNGLIAPKDRKMAEMQGRVDENNKALMERIKAFFEGIAASIQNMFSRGSGPRP